jgi:hypothetical protein
VSDTPETDAELIDRWRRVTKLVADARKKMERMQYGPARERQARWGGSLGFTLLQIVSKMEERNIPIPKE